MRSSKPSWLIALVLVGGTAMYAIAEDITLTTYYPSPRGVYDQLRSMGQTLLAQSGGGVGIGTGPTTPDASAVLDIRSTTQGLLPPRMTENERKNILAPADGLLVFDTTNGALFQWARGAWNKILQSTFQLIQERTLPASPVGNQTLTGTWSTLGGGCPGVQPLGDQSIGSLCLTAKTPQRGLYLITWSGSVCVDAAANEVASIQAIFTSAGGLAVNISKIDIPDLTPGAANAAPCAGSDLQDMSGSSIIQLGAGKNYQVRLRGMRTGGGSNKSDVQGGATIKMELFLPL